MRYCAMLLMMLLLAGCGVTDSAPRGDSAHGERIFREGLNDAPPCMTCHQTAANATGFSLGPNLAGVAERAATRIDGMTADDYLRQSILDPHRYLVPGYRSIMYPQYATVFNDQDVLDIIAFLRTL
ncbi:MAG: cytochrome c [Anaerolineae bacterium]|nr:cytochrome c [Anaerolineae bacterium]